MRVILPLGNIILRIHRSKINQIIPSVFRDFISFKFFFMLSNISFEYSLMISSFY